MALLERLDIKFYSIFVFREARQAVFRLFLLIRFGFAPGAVLKGEELYFPIKSIFFLKA